MADGTRSGDLPSKSLVDEFICNTDSGIGKETVRVPFSAARAQLAIGSGIAFATWSALSATTGASAGQRADAQRFARHVTD